jgi:Lsr2
MSDVTVHAACRHLKEIRMSQKVTVSLEDDLDGSPAAETLRFALAGVDYEIDLSEQHASAFRQQLSPFVEHARRAGRVKVRSSGRSSANRERTADIRSWAREHCVAINERGRIPASVIEQYEAAIRG